MIDDTILEAARDAVLDLAVTSVTRRDDARPALLADAVDWLATHREWQALHRHLLRQADRLLDDARQAAWDEHYTGR